MNKLLTRKILIRLITIIIFTALYIAEIPLKQYMPGIEGVTLGINNAVILAGLFVIGEPIVLFMFFLKIVLHAIFHNTNVVYLLAGGLLSLGSMYALKRFTKKFGIIGISIIGAVIYNLTTWVIACKQISNNILINNLPLLLVFSIIYGVITGVIAFQLIRICGKHKIGGYDE